MLATLRIDGTALMLQGDLCEWSIFDVLQLVASSRRYTAVELRDARGAVLGTLYIRCGDVLAIEYGTATGADAVVALLLDAPHSFAVFRLPELGTYPVVIASLQEILFRLAEPPTTMTRAVAAPCGVYGARAMGRTTRAGGA